MGLTKQNATATTSVAPNRDFIDLLNGFSLTTAEILYRLPDHPALLQTYLWQDYDLHPRFPKLTAFLDFWNAKLEGKLFRVCVAHSRLIKPSEIKMVDGQFRLN
jgi:uncharacterized protein Usg